MKYKTAKSKVKYQPELYQLVFSVKKLGLQQNVTVLYNEKEHFDKYYEKCCVLTIMNNDDILPAWTSEHLMNLNINLCCMLEFMTNGIL